MECDLIERHSEFHPGLYDNLNAIRKYGIDNWIDNRGKHYKWTGGNE